MDWCCIAVINDEITLAQNLGASPALQAEPERLTVLRNQPSASIAYNAGLDQTQARICVFAHQDVYLPLGWEDRFEDQVAQLDRIDPDWAVAGLFGIGCEGAPAGRVWCTGNDCELGGPFKDPVSVQSLDELLIVINRDSGIRFDPGLPSFHLYATDIVQTALSSGKGAYVMDAPVVHNSLPTPNLWGGFTVAYDHIRKKWQEQLPIITPCTRVTPSGWYLRIQNIRKLRFNFRHRKRVRLALSLPRPDPRAIARKLGYE